MKNNGSILAFGTGLVLTAVSCAYFISTILHLPFAAAVALALFMSVIGIHQLSKNIISNNQQEHRKEEWIAFGIFITGLGILVYQSTLRASKDGGWDAWAIWNLNAKFLTAPDTWRMMLNAETNPHPDYPLMLPAGIAFFNRLLHAPDFITPFALAATIFILIPSLIFFELRRQSLLCAAAILAWLVLDDGYARIALSQLADTLLGFFLLCAIVTLRYYRAVRNPRLLVLTGAFLGACIWTKNEGMLLVMLTLAFNWRIALSRLNLKWLVAGMALPLICYIVFKTGYAPQNDLVAKHKSIGIDYLMDVERYRIIWEALKEQFSKQYFYYLMAMVFYAITLIWKRTLPQQDMLLVMSCLVMYLVVYLFTPMDLQWHINTSFDRLIHQLAPSFLYLFGLQLCSLLAGGQKVTEDG